MGGGSCAGKNRVEGLEANGQALGFENVENGANQEHQLGVGSNSPRTCGTEANRPDVSGRCLGDGVGPQALVTNWVRDSSFMPYQHPC